MKIQEEIDQFATIYVEFNNYQKSPDQRGSKPVKFKGETHNVNTQMENN